MWDQINCLEKETLQNLPYFIYIQYGKFRSISPDNLIWLHILIFWRVSTKIFLQWILADDEQLAKFKQKFAYFSDYFHLLEAIRGQHNNFSLHFKCKMCSEYKILKSDSRAPTSNLSKHIDRNHPELSGQFLTPRYSMPRGNNKFSAVSIQQIWIWINPFHFVVKSISESLLEFC